LHFWLGIPSDEEEPMRRIGFVLALALVAGGVATAREPRADPSGQMGTAGADPSPTDRDFARRAGAGGLAEVKLARLALDKGQSTEVKEFARKMLADHSKVNTELKRIAENKKLALPTRLDDEQQQRFDRLSRLSGPEFDAAYMDAMVADHDAEVAAFEEQAQSGRDPELKQFAMKTLPVLQRHEEHARKSQQALDRAKEK
jgi:putative membrane protein